MQKLLYNYSYTSTTIKQTKKFCWWVVFEKIRYGVVALWSLQYRITVCITDDMCISVLKTDAMCMTICVIDFMRITICITDFMCITVGTFPILHSFQYNILHISLLSLSSTQQQISISVDQQKKADYAQIISSIQLFYS